MLGSEDFNLSSFIPPFFFFSCLCCSDMLGLDNSRSNIQPKQRDTENRRTFNFLASFADEEVDYCTAASSQVAQLDCWKNRSDPLLSVPKSNNRLLEIEWRDGDELQQNLNFPRCPSWDAAANTHFSYECLNSFSTIHLKAFSILITLFSIFYKLIISQQILIYIKELNVCVIVSCVFLLQEFNSVNYYKKWNKSPSINEFSSQFVK